MVPLVQMLQVALGLAWLGPLALLWSATWRVLTGRADMLDVVRAPHWLVALFIELGCLRWLVFPASLRVMGAEELTYWAAVYLIGIGSAFGVTVGTRFGERLRK